MCIAVDRSNPRDGTSSSSQDLPSTSSGARIVESCGARLYPWTQNSARSDSSLFSAMWSRWPLRHCCSRQLLDSVSLPALALLTLNVSLVLAIVDWTAYAPRRFLLRMGSTDLKGSRQWVQRDSAVLPQNAVPPRFRLPRRAKRGILFVLAGHGHLLSYSKRFSVHPATCAIPQTLQQVLSTQSSGTG